MVDNSGNGSVPTSRKSSSSDVKCIHEIFEDLYKGQSIDVLLNDSTRTKEDLICKHDANNALHLLYKYCPSPHHLLQLTKKLVGQGVEINGRGEQNNTPLFYLLLNVNRGLKYDTSQYVETCLGPRSREHQSRENAKNFDSNVCQVDQLYQDEVYDTLDFLLRSGADVNVEPSYFPVICRDVIWDRYITDLLLLNRSCWYFLQDAGDEFFKAYCEFNPLKLKRIVNSSKYKLFHLAAWRGRCDIMKLMLPYVDDPSIVSSNGMNALHFLFSHFTFPHDASNCTKLLLDAKVDIHQRDKEGLTPLFYLLRHLFVKKCFYQCMATAHCFTANCGSDKEYNSDVSECLNILVSAGANLEQKDSGFTCLSYFFMLLSETVITQRNHQVALDNALGSNEFPWNPFIVDLGPVIRTTEVLLQNGAQSIINVANSSGRTPLEFYLKTWRNDRLLSEGNTAEDMIQCLKVLLDAGADPNCVITDGLSSPVAKVVCGIAEFIKNNYTVEQFIPALDLLFQHGANPNLVLRTEGSVLHLLFAHISKHLQELQYSVIHDNALQEQQVVELMTLFKYLFRRGMSPNVVNSCKLYPIEMIPLWTSLNKYDPLLETTIQLMDRASAAEILAKLDTGHQSNLIQVLQTLYRDNSSRFRMFSLQHICRFAIYSHMRTYFYDSCWSLPLPKSLQAYLWELVDTRHF